jgi:UDP-2,3-diacylglucosamine pyrophosphatase LpxH
VRLAWLTDVHLNFLQPPRIEAFLADVRLEVPDAVVITGDIGEARSIGGYLRQLADGLSAPIYFVLGNHDFYFGSIRETREAVGRLSTDLPRLTYLTTSGVIRLSDEWGLVGHDGWADARLGDYEHSEVMFNDYWLISELRGASKEMRRRILMSLGDEAAEHIRRTLPAALEQFPQVMLAMHVPPYREACWHQGGLSDSDWLPHLTCQAAGQAMLDIMARYPHRNLTVLCGHTHSPGEAQLRDNLRVLTGGAQYGAPAVQRVFDLA